MMDETRIIGIRLSVASEVELTEIVLRFRSLRFARTQTRARGSLYMRECEKARVLYRSGSREVYLPTYLNPSIARIRTQDTLNDVPLVATPLFYFCVAIDKFP